MGRNIRWCLAWLINRPLNRFGQRNVGKPFSWQYIKIQIDKHGVFVIKNLIYYYRIQTRRQ